MDFATKWIEAKDAQLNSKSLSEEEEQAIIKFYDLASDEPDEAIKLALQVIEHEPRIAIIHCLGAGPVEELLVKHPSYLGELITLAEENEKLIQCLSHVNLSEDDVESTNLLAHFLEKKLGRLD